jgi:hypothetical protein
MSILNDRPATIASGHRYAIQYPPRREPIQTDPCWHTFFVDPMPF